MAQTSPATLLVWSVLSTLLGAFLLGHLWAFDRFKCLKWSSGPYSGAFKRIMTYTYLLSVPLITAYAYGFTFMKYEMGYFPLPGGGYTSMPYPLWPKKYQNAIFPLTMMFSLAWSLEMVTHLEELCFWLFLLNAGPNQPDWFRSPYSKIWAVGSVMALILMPTITSLSRSDPLKMEARTFLAGSSGDLVLNMFFIPILFKFPNFVRSIKKEGVDLDVIVRLTKFYELNVIRIVFRILFAVPFFALGIDGIHGHHFLNTHLIWTDVLAITGGFGCVISSVITLLIFFPRSTEMEVRAREASFERASHDLHLADPELRKSPDSAGTFLLTDSPVRATFALADPNSANPFRSPPALEVHELQSPWGTADVDSAASLPQVTYAKTSRSPPHKPPRPVGPRSPTIRVREDEQPSRNAVLTQDNLQRHNQGTSVVNPFVHSFTSPIGKTSIPLPGYGSIV
ncbi:hypothetical protein BD410DRAFT_731400 [Rickenella mellea]|uniref:Uncharacterized protein n=1 Tax=Rickenella mellea TaxID=50990 RepID=A0A4Y7PM03_9AGAM|nr:hypothetical protein BD410DRAFT_731400 [Rickenella mellea]